MKSQDPVMGFAIPGSCCCFVWTVAWLQCSRTVKGLAVWWEMKELSTVERRLWPVNGYGYCSDKSLV